MQEQLHSRLADFGFLVGVKQLRTEVARARTATADDASADAAASSWTCLGLLTQRLMRSWGPAAGSASEKQPRGGCPTASSASGADWATGSRSVRYLRHAQLESPRAPSPSRNPRNAGSARLPRMLRDSRGARCVLRRLRQPSAARRDETRLLDPPSSHRSIRGAVGARNHRPQVPTPVGLRSPPGKPAARGRCF